MTEEGELGVETPQRKRDVSTAHGAVEHENISVLVSSSHHKTTMRLRYNLQLLQPMHENNAILEMTIREPGC